MARLESDLVPLLLAACEGKLAGQTIRWKDDPAMVVVMAAAGYPGAYKKGGVISGFEAANAVPGVKVLHAGTGSDAEGRVVATGGRVLGVTASAPTLAEARERAYKAVDLIEWQDGFCRRDIGWRALG
jgi:phosphoribosylamine--glycine ligase